MLGRNQLAIVLAEFLGTGALALAVLSVQHSTIGLPYFVGLAAGLMIAVMMITFGRDGGAHFNPAITIGMWTTRQIKTIPAVAYIVAQMLGAWAAYYLYTYFVKTSLQATGGHYDSHILVAEAVGAFIFSLVWAAAVFNRFSPGKWAATVGAAFTLAVVVASSASIGIVNPALALSERSFAVFGPMGWGTYALGPVLGAIIGFNLYALLFAPESSFMKMQEAVGRLGRTTSAAPVAAAPATTTSTKSSSKSTAKRSTKRASKSKK